MTSWWFTPAKDYSLAVPCNEMIQGVIRGLYRKSTNLGYPKIIEDIVILYAVGKSVEAGDS